MVLFCRVNLEVGNEEALFHCCFERGAMRLLVARLPQEPEECITEKTGDMKYLHSVSIDVILTEHCLFLFVVCSSCHGLHE